MGGSGAAGQVGRPVATRKQPQMITTVVQFNLPAPVTREKASELYAATAPKYQIVGGLIRKYYLLSEDGRTGGGVYLWKSKAHAEKLFTPEWRQFIKERYGAEPQISFFETPILVDNLTGEIIQD